MSNDLFPVDDKQQMRDRLTKRGWYQIGVDGNGEMLWQNPGSVSLPEPYAFALLERMERGEPPFPDAGPSGRRPGAGQDGVAVNSVATTPPAL